MYKFSNNLRSQLNIVHDRTNLKNENEAPFNRALNSDSSPPPRSPSCAHVLSLTPINEYVNIKRQSVSHPPISVQTRALRFSLGEKIISGSRAAIFSPSVEQRAPQFTAFGPINVRYRLQTFAAFSRRGRILLQFLSFHTLNRFSVTGKFPRANVRSTQRTLGAMLYTEDNRTQFTA